MHLAIINMEIQRAVRLEHSAGLDQARLEKSQVVVKQVGIRFLPDADGLVAAALKAGAVAGAIFGTDSEGFLRMNIATPRKLVKEALKRMSEAVNSLG